MIKMCGRNDGLNIVAEARATIITKMTVRKTELILMVRSTATMVKEDNNDCDGTTREIITTMKWPSANTTVALVNWMLKGIGGRCGHTAQRLIHTFCGLLW